MLSLALDALQVLFCLVVVLATYSRGKKYQQALRTQNEILEQKDKELSALHELLNSALEQVSKCKCRRRVN